MKFNYFFVLLNVVLAIPLIAMEQASVPAHHISIVKPDSHNDLAIEFTVLSQILCIAQPEATAITTKRCLDLFLKHLEKDKRMQEHLNKIYNNFDFYEDPDNELSIVVKPKSSALELQNLAKIERQQLTKMINKMFSFSRLCSLPNIIEFGSILFGKEWQPHVLATAKKIIKNQSKKCTIGLKIDGHGDPEHQTIAGIAKKHFKEFIYFLSDLNILQSEFKVAISHAIISSCYIGAKVVNHDIFDRDLSFPIIRVGYGNMPSMQSMGCLSFSRIKNPFELLQRAVNSESKKFNNGMCIAALNAFYGVDCAQNIPSIRFPQKQNFTVINDNDKIGSVTNSIERKFFINQQHIALDKQIIEKPIEMTKWAFLIPSADYDDYYIRNLSLQDYDPISDRLDNMLRPIFNGSPARSINPASNKRIDEKRIFIKKFTIEKYACGNADKIGAVAYDNVLALLGKNNRDQFFWTENNKDWRVKFEGRDDLDGEFENLNPESKATIEKRMIIDEIEKQRSKSLRKNLEKAQTSLFITKYQNPNSNVKCISK